MKTQTKKTTEINYHLSEKLPFFENLLENEEKKLYKFLMGDYSGDIQVFHWIKSSLEKLTKIIDELSPEQYSSKISDDIKIINGLMFDKNLNFIDEPYELTKRFVLHFNKHYNNADENFMYRTKYYSTIMNFVNEVVQRMAAKLQEDTYELNCKADHKIKLVGF